MSYRESAPTARAVLLAVSASGDDTLLWSVAAGRPLFAWSLAALRAAPEIGPIVLIVPRSRLAKARRLIAAERFADVVVRADLTPQPPLLGGEGEAGSSPPGPLAPQGEGEAEVIVLHDAARPLISAGQIASLMAAAAESGVAVSAEPVKETIKRVAAGQVIETLPRDELVQLIPPLAIRADVPHALLEMPGHPSRLAIADLVAAALARGVVVRAVPLAGASLAVTTAEDLAVAEALLRAPGG